MTDCTATGLRNVFLDGATGLYAPVINGMWDITAETTIGGSNVYRKRNNHDIYLEYHATTKNWVIRPINYRGTNKAFAFSCITDPVDVILCPGNWTVRNNPLDENGVFHLEPSLTVSRIGLDKITDAVLEVKAFNQTTSAELVQLKSSNTLMAAANTQLTAANLTLSTQVVQLKATHAAAIQALNVRLARLEQKFEDEYGASEEASSVSESGNERSSNPCNNWAKKGYCRFGDGCRYSHYEAPRDKCYAFRRGECDRGSSCRFEHSF